MVRLSLPARRLLAYLAIRGRPIPRPVASAELWPDLPEECGRANLRRSLWNVPSGWVDARGDELWLDADTDLQAAQAAAAQAIAGAELRFEDIHLLTEDILPGWQEEWILPMQDRFRALRIEALEATCRTMTAAGKLALAIQAGSAALAAEPLRESAAEALIDAHFVQGNRYEALRCFRSLQRALQEELGVLPNPVVAARFAATVAA